MASGGVGRASGLVHIVRNDAFQHIGKPDFKNQSLSFGMSSAPLTSVPMQSTHATASFATRRECHRRLSLPMYALIIACEHPGAIHEDIRFFSESDRDFGPPFQR
jgi:hypothetical protein